MVFAASLAVTLSI